MHEVVRMATHALQSAEMAVWARANEKEVHMAESSGMGEAAHAQCSCGPGRLLTDET